MQSLIPYPSDNRVAAILGEDGVLVETEPYAPGLVTLLSFAGDLALAPGDVLAIDDVGAVTGIHRLAPVFLFEVFVNMPTVDPDNDTPETVLNSPDWDLAVLLADEVEQQVAELARTHRGTSLTLTVVTEDRGWFDAWVAGCDLVASYAVVRAPGMPVDLGVELSAAVPPRDTYDRQGRLIGAL